MGAPLKPAVDLAAAEPVTTRPSREEAEAAVRTLLAYIGEDPARDGLIETPARFVKAYDEFFDGYGKSAADLLDKSFEETGGYDDIVLVRDIPFHSHCEHHVVPIIGKAHIGYLPSPDRGVVGLSKFARVVDIFAHRLQTQERLTAEIAAAIEQIVVPRGLAVMLESQHLCMALRGPLKPGATTVTTAFTGSFKDQPGEQMRFMMMVRGQG